MMTRDQIGLWLAAAMVALAVGLAAALAVTVPAKLGYWIAAGLTMPLLWLFAERVARGQATLRLSVAGAASVIAIAEGLALARALDLIAADSESLALRAVCIACGIAIVVSGNMVPKRRACFDPAAPDAARKQAAQRFSGWTFVLAGLANTLIWIFMPVDDAALWSMVPLAVALLLVAAQWNSIRGSRA
jgi:hypothetical protein